MKLHLKIELILTNNNADLDNYSATVGQSPNATNILFGRPKAAPN